MITGFIVLISGDGAVVVHYWEVLHPFVDVQIDQIMMPDKKFQL